MEVGGYLDHSHAGQLDMWSKVTRMGQIYPARRMGDEGIIGKVQENRR
jgi:hypothetical protein